jgi:hypothetical protein
MKDYSLNLATRVMNILDEYNVEYFFKEDTGTILFGGIRNSIETSSLHFMIMVCSDSITAHAITGMHADPDNTEQMYRLMRFLSIVNYQLRDGCFITDVRDGEVQYRCYRDSIPDDDAWKAAVHEVIVLPAVMFRRYLKGMFLAMYGIMKPEDAVEICDKDAVARACRKAQEEPEDSDCEDDGDEDEEPFVICEDNEEDEADEEEDEENPYDYFVYKTKVS